MAVETLTVGKKSFFLVDSPLRPLAPPRPRVGLVVKKRLQIFKKEEEKIFFP